MAVIGAPARTEIEYRGRLEQCFYYLGVTVVFLDSVIVHSNILRVDRPVSLAGGSVAGDLPGLPLPHPHRQHEGRAGLTDHRLQSDYQE